MGAVILKNGNPISVGFNQVKTNPDGWWKGLHAEVHAIKNAGKARLKKASIFVYRETRDGEIANARPCPRCMDALRENGFKWVFYTTDNYPYFDVERL